MHHNPGCFVGYDLTGTVKTGLIWLMWQHGYAKFPQNGGFADEFYAFNITEEPEERISGGYVIVIAFQDKNWRFEAKQFIHGSVDQG